MAEGAGEELLGQSVEVDASGNRKLPARGVCGGWSVGGGEE